MATVVEATYEANRGRLILDRKLSLTDQARVRVAIESLSQPPSLARKLSGQVVIAEEVARHIVETEDLVGVD